MNMISNFLSQMLSIQHIIVLQIRDHSVYTKDVSEASEKKCQDYITYTDFFKGLDRVNYNIYLAKFVYYGVTGIVLKWLRRYFAGRKQIVQFFLFHFILFNLLLSLSEGAHHLSFFSIR